MKCDYTCLNHNSLLSKKKIDHQGCDYKGGLLLYVTKPQVIGSM